ncbi:MAG TPA: NAD-dependent epimerase/dehydratase family protein [Xanthomonadaceae bacterium]|nr:NAD-dependent epimerase/dehydratase family protein [Xanthomonadaceae bacterium]
MRVLVLGASGQIGRFLVPQLTAAGHQVLAASRSPPPVRSGAGVQWIGIDLPHPPAAPVACDAVISAGPLTHFAAWLSHQPLRGVARVVAFSSTSAEAKATSADHSERAVAAALREAEALVQDWAQARSAPCFVLRPTLIYGAGLDHNLSRIAALARRFGVFVLPRGAVGLRQPVHAGDLAIAAVNALGAPAAAAGCHVLAGGETLAYREMVRRVLAAQAPPAWLLAVPSGLLRLALGTARALGWLRGANAQMIARMAQDLCFDDGPARQLLGHRPRAFTPTAADFTPPGR